MKILNHINALCKDMETRYPDLWKDVEWMTGAKEDYPWADWCYLPIGASVAIVNKGTDKELNLHDAAVLSSLSAWRLTKGIYKYHPDIFKGLWNASGTGKIPKEIVFSIPQYCLFIECPYPIYLLDKQILGWFYSLEDDRHNNTQEMRFVFLLDDPDMRTFNFMVHIEDTVREGLDKTFEIIRGKNKSWNMASQMILFQYQEEIIKHIQSIISVTLYLCTKHAEVENKNGEKPFKPPYPVNCQHVIPLREEEFFVGYQTRDFDKLVEKNLRRKAIEQHIAQSKIKKNIQEFHDLEYTIKERKYPNLPKELENFYLYIRDSGHSIIAIPKTFEEEAKKGNMDDYECPIPVKYVLEHEYQIIGNGEYVIVDAPYSHEFGIDVDVKYYEY